MSEAGAKRKAQPPGGGRNGDGGGDSSASRPGKRFKKHDGSGKGRRHGGSGGAWGGAAAAAAGGGGGGGAAGGGGGDVPAASAAGKDSASAADKQAAKRAKRAHFKALRRAKLLAHMAAPSLPKGLAAVVTPGVASHHPFHTEPRDHAETPLAAYQDLEPLLFRLAERLGKRKEELVIYDPFYCEGSVKAHLASLGFANVINDNVDFYEQLESGKVPPHDVLVTNPPFSADHMQRTLRFAAEGNAGRPFFLLLPDFVAKKPYYRPFFESLSSRQQPAAAGDRKQQRQQQRQQQQQQPKAAAEAAAEAAPPVFYLGPRHKVYLFTAPRSRAAGDGDGEDDGSGAAPLLPSRSFECPAVPFQVFTAGAFQCVWFVHLGAAHGGTILSWWRKKYEAKGLARCAVADDPLQLPQLATGPKRGAKAATAAAPTSTALKEASAPTLQPTSPEQQRPSGSARQQPSASRGSNGPDSSRGTRPSKKNKKYKRDGPGRASADKEKRNKRRHSSAAAVDERDSDD